MKLAGLVILYHPPISVVDNLLTYYDAVDQLYVFDNTEQHSSAALFTHLTRVVYIHNGDNSGISKRLNEGYKMAIAAGYNWLLTMDQDSRFPEQALPLYLQCVSAYKKEGQVAVFGPYYNDFNTASLAKCVVEHTKYILTSGALINLPVCKQLGGFDENLFIDSVDHEYCLRAQVNGYETVQFTNILLHHLVGSRKKRSSIKTLYLKKKLKTVHSPLRCYYLKRNMLYLAEQYASYFPEFIKHNKMVVSLHLNWSFWYGGQAWQTLRYILKAKRDFKNGQMGKISDVQ